MADEIALENSLEVYKQQVSGLSDPKCAVIISLVQVVQVESAIAIAASSLSSAADPELLELKENLCELVRLTEGASLCNK